MKGFLNPNRKGREAKRKKSVKAVLAVFCAIAVMMTSFSPALPTASVYAAANTKLDNLVIDKVYEMHPTGETSDGIILGSNGFSSEITQYEGTVYSSVEELKIYPFAASSTATVTVNDVNLRNGFTTIRVDEPGVYPVTVKVRDGGQETIYQVAVTKVDTDYRGRRAIVKNDEIMEKLSVKTESGDPAKLLEILKKDNLVTLPESNTANQYVNTSESYWETYLPPADESASAEATSFTVDLGDVYSISRIRSLVGPANLGLGGNKVRISVSTDGEHWEVPITKGNLNTGTQWHQNVIRYEFGVSHQARYIKYEITNWQNKQMKLRLYQFMIYYDGGNVPEEQPAPEGGSVPYQNEDRHQYLTSGQATVIERGLPLSGWTPSGGYGRGIPTREEAEQFGYDGPLFYDPDFENKDYMLYNPDALWGIAKAPFGGNTMGDAGEPRDFMPESMNPYINNAISLCFGDEGRYSTEEAVLFGKWFQWTKERYPGIILHSNQGGDQWTEQQLREFMRIAKPDMLSWDNYYSGSSVGGHNLSLEHVQKDAARRLMSVSNWEIYRKLAYEGVDGSGSKPILFGQYLDTYETNSSESSKNLQTNLSLVTGAKWLNFFRLEYQFDRSYLWDEDGTPTRGLLEWKQIIDRIHAVDDQLNRLNNDWVMFKLGSIGSTAHSPNGFRRGDFDSEQSREKNAEFGIKSVSVKSLSKVFNGGTGDVVLGYFNTVPGLYESEIAEYFEEATAPKGFMVMNGLMAGDSETYKNFNIPRRDMGSSKNTRQEITITPSDAFAAQKLYCVDKDDRDGDGNGIIKEVEKDANGNFTMVLGGGESNLYFWALKTTAKANTQTEGAYASFAFDGHPSTYWEPEAPAEDGTYTVEKTFAPMPVNQVTIMEKGDEVRGYQVEYLAEDSQWLPFGDEGKAIGAAALVSTKQAVNASGIRLKITDASQAPAIYDISYASNAKDPNKVYVITVNDNTMGTGLNRFQYDDKWSYRENELNGSGIEYYPLENDGHFSNFDGAEAKFRFYGTKVELLLRGNQAANIKAKILDKNGMIVGQEKTGTATGSLIFDSLPQDTYTLVITKKTSNQAGIDGAKVTYQGLLPEDENEGEKAEQIYVNQRTTSSHLTDYFTYKPQWSTVNMGSNNNDFGVYEGESDKWVEHVQEHSSHNCGFTRTNSPNAYYTMNFYGTGVQLYTSVLPVDNQASIEYGDLEFELDGELVEVSYKNVTSEGSIPDAIKNNAKTSVRVAEIQVPNAAANDNHTLKVTVKNGYNRIDYAVVNRYAEGGDYKIKLNVGTHGSAVAEPGSMVTEGGAAVIRITPDPGYQIADIVLDDKSAQIPENGILVIKNVKKDITVKITFRRRLYPIVLDKTMEGGAVVPDKFVAEAGAEVIIKPEPNVGYKLKADSVTVTEDAGAEVAITPVENGSFRFIMPKTGVKLKAEFEATPYAIETGNLLNGKIVTEPANQAVYRQMVTVKVQPEDGYQLKEGSLKAVLENGGTLALDEAEDSAEYTFSMPAQKVTLQAIFEKIPKYTITVANSVENGSVELGRTEVEEGGQVEITFKPDAGYALGLLELNEESWYVPKGKLILSNIDRDIVIAPKFVGSNSTFHTGSAAIVNEEGGSIEPEEQLVLDKGKAVLIAHPEPGYRAKSVTVITRDSIEIASESNARRHRRAAGGSKSRRHRRAIESDVHKYEIASGSDAHRLEIASGSNAMDEIRDIIKDYPFPDDSNKIVIPNLAEDFDMRVTFDQIMYPISVEKAAHGTLTADLKTAGYNQTVTVTVAADQGYRLKEDSLKVVTETGEQQNLNETEAGKVYTFKMPLSPVTITALFEADPYPPTDPDKPKPPTDSEKPTPPQSDSSSDESVPVYTGTSGWGSDRKGWRYRKNGIYVVSSWEYLDWNGKPGWYYFGPDEYMVSGWLLDQTGHWYYLDSISEGDKGRMKTGWLLDADGRWYYLNPVSDGFMGKMALGWQEVEGKWYYFNEVSDGTRGALLVNTTTPDGFLVGPDGARIN